MRNQDRQPSTTGDSAGVAAEDLFRRIVEIINDARGRVTRVVNSTMVQTYWEIGRQIVQVEQQGDQRAGYGEQVLAGLSERLMLGFGRGFSLPNLKRMRRFFLAYSPNPAIAAAGNDNRDQQIGSTLSSQLATIVQPAFLQ